MNAYFMKFISSKFLSFDGFTKIDLTISSGVSIDYLLCKRSKVDFLAAGFSEDPSIIVEIYFTASFKFN